MITLNILQGSPEETKLSEAMNKILDMPVYSKGNKKIIDDIEKRGLPMPENPTIKDYVVASVIMSAAYRGQISDLLEIMEILGERPLEPESNALKEAKSILADIESVID